MRTKSILAVVFYLMVLEGSAQNTPKATPWFTVTVISPKVWAIDDHQAANCYLVEGKDSALLIDTGIGAADLLAQVGQLTHKPLIVVNTHGHPDHSGANYQFAKIYLAPGDSAAARNYMLPASRAGAAKMARGATPQPGETYKGKEIASKLVVVKDGTTFKLGGRTIEVIETPGHTPGSICLLDKANKLLFTGDNDNTLVWLFLPNCLPLSAYLKSLQKLEKRVSEFDTLLPGHGVPMKSDFISDQIMCVKSILDHTCKPEPYESFAGKAMLCKYNRSSVAFNPENL